MAARYCNWSNLVIFWAIMRNKNKQLGPRGLGRNWRQKKKDPCCVCSASSQAGRSYRHVTFWKMDIVSLDITYGHYGHYGHYLWTLWKLWTLWTLPVDITSGHRKWTSPVDITSGHHQWTLPEKTNCGYYLWTLQELLPRRPRPIILFYLNTYNVILKYFDFCLL